VLTNITHHEFHIGLLGARTFDQEWGPKSFQEECLFDLFAFDDHGARYIRPRLGYRKGFDPNMLAYMKIKGLQ
jgi:hypothetical protein